MAKKTNPAKKTQKAENQDSVNERPYPRLQVQFDMGYEGTYNPVSKEKSQTVPDLNLTVRQLLTNHSRGLSNDRHLKDPIYFDFKIPQVKDLTDVADFKQYLEEQIKAVNEFIEQDKQDAQDKKASKKAADKAELERLKKEYEKDEQLDIENEA